MKMKSRCQYSEKCNAPLCPMFTEEENKKFFWKPTQDVCRKKDVPNWVKKQRKIIRYVHPTNSATYFHITMLGDDLRVNRKIKGLVSKDLNLLQPIDKEEENIGEIVPEFVNPN